MNYRITVRVMPKAGISDPEGMAILDAAHHLGHDKVMNVHAGKSFEIEGAFDSIDEARERTHELAERLLANPVIETFELVGVEELS